jgi:hypothetical protein
MADRDLLAMARETAADLEALRAVAAALPTWGAAGYERVAVRAAYRELAAEHRVLGTEFMDVHARDMAGDLDGEAHARLRARLEDLAARLRRLSA